MNSGIPLAAEEPDRYSRFLGMQENSSVVKEANAKMNETCPAMITDDCGKPNSPTVAGMVTSPVPSIPH